MHHETVIPDWHPFKSQIWAGSCDSGQLTAGGLRDAIKHGQVRFGVPLVRQLSGVGLTGEITGFLGGLFWETRVPRSGEREGDLRQDFGFG